MLLLYSAALFVSSGLLFLIQPMFAKMVTPLLGGTPHVWVTCMMFFQTTLLVGYGISHVTTRLWGERRQSKIHLVFLLMPILALPIAIPDSWTPPETADPTLWLLGLLGVTVGLPFVALATSGPLLQMWFSKTTHVRAADPYFLYAGSNLGSMLALLSYPALFEPRFRLPEQSLLWSAGYAVFVALSGAAAVSLWRSPNSGTERPPLQTEALSMLRRGRWVALAFVPSSLMLGVTSMFTSDLAAVPLFWVIPLALYLLTMILTFSRRRWVPHRFMVHAFNTALLCVVIVHVAGITVPLSLVAPIHLLGFFVVAMVCHGELAGDRPAAAHLTEFYLWIGLGGMLGGVFNALLAPLLFDGLTEYSLALALSAFLCPRRPSESVEFRRADVLVPIAVTLAAATLSFLHRNDAFPDNIISRFFIAGVPALLCLSAAGRPLRFGLAIAGTLLSAILYPAFERGVVYADRSFFGIHRIINSPALEQNILMHGSTAHGTQKSDRNARPKEPVTALGYYHPKGPIGSYLTSIRPGIQRRVAIVGLGSGGLLAHAQPGQQVTYYEIDPLVRWIAEDSGYFSFVRQARASGTKVDIVLGDARLALARAPAATYDLLILDAFSSDHIPVHLATLEAFRDVYLPRLTSNGVIAMHISNRYVDFSPLVVGLAERLGLTSLHKGDKGAEDRWPTRWVLFARRLEHLSPANRDPGWKTPSAGEASMLWTDDFSNVLGLFRAGH